MYYSSGKAIYFTNSPEADGAVQPSEHIADCESEEKAHFLVHVANHTSDKFIPQALVTCSHEFHGDMVSMAEFKGRLNGAIDALNKLDQVKKTLFYGRDNNLIADGARDASSVIENFGGNDNAIVGSIAADIIHAVIGYATEAGELLEALKLAINGHPFDWVNVKEELGDGDWYKAILANHGDFTFEEAMWLIIPKLRARYPDKFDAFNAVNRNLELERSILENGTSHVPLEQLADGPTSETVTELAATPPIGGEANIRAMEPNINEAFDARKPTSEPVEAIEHGTNSELAKSPAERLNPLPDEHLAQQPVRPEDAEK